MNADARRSHVSSNGNVEGITQAPPGSAEGGPTVTDIEAAHDELLSRGINVGNVWHGAHFLPEARSAGPTPRIPATSRSALLNDPDGNAWLVQEVTARRHLPTAAAQAISNK